MAQTWTYTTTYAGTGTVTGWFQTEETNVTIPASGSTFRIKTPRVKVAATASRNDWTWGSTRKTKASVHPSWRTAGLWITSGYSGSVSMGAYSDWQTINDSSSFNTADYFNSSNPTERTISFGSWQGGVVDCVYDGSGTNSTLYIPCYNNNSSANMFTFATVYVQLDVPPTADVSPISYDTGYIYSDLTTASVTVSNSTAYYDGTISSVEFKIGNQTATAAGDGTLSIALNAGGTFTPTVTVTDSRGQTYTETFSPITVNVYTAPTVSFDVARTLNDGTPDDEGTYGLIEATLTFADVIATAIAPSVVLTDDDGTQTTPTVTWYTNSSLTTQVTWANVSSGDTVYGLFSGLSTQHSYQVSVRPRDSEGTGTAITQVIGAAFYTVDFLAGGHGIAFGKPASNVGFECAMDASFTDAAGTMRALFDFIYPVGSYYETSDTTFDPNVTWGGTWALETEGQVHISAGANYSVVGALTNVTDGGEATHTLDIDEMPNHRHAMSNNGSSGTNTSGGGGYFVEAAYDGRNPKYSSYVGGGLAHNNMQPYIVVNRWHRTA